MRSPEWGFRPRCNSRATPVTTLPRVSVFGRSLWPPERFAALLLIPIWLLLASPYPPSLRSTGTLLILVLLVLDVLLGAASDWMAFARPSTLDQRQVAIQNRAFRLAFLLIAVGIAVAIALSIAGGLSTRRIVALLELVFIAPTAVIAWQLPAEQDIVWHRKGTLRSWAPTLAIPVLAVIWLTAVGVLPPRTVTVQNTPNGHYAWGSTCSYFAARKDVGYGLGGAVRMGAEVCWNGETAWPVGTAPFRTDCGPTEGDADFATVAVTCTVQGGNGGMLMIARGKISPLPGSLAARDIELRLIVGPSGNVVSFG
jgi:hypothetical protein